MTDLRQYILSVITAALISAILSETAGKGSGKNAVRMVCGLFLAVSFFSPLTFRMETDFSKLYRNISEDADREVSSGKAMATGEISAVIKEQTESYIENKAAQFNTALTAEVILDDNSIPCKAILHGSITESARTYLEVCCTTELGIPKENLTWTG